MMDIYKAEARQWREGLQESDSCGRDCRAVGTARRLARTLFSSAKHVCHTHHTLPPHCHTTASLPQHPLPAAFPFHLGSTLETVWYFGPGGLPRGCRADGSTCDFSVPRRCHGEATCHLVQAPAHVPPSQELVRVSRGAGAGHGGGGEGHWFLKSKRAGCWFPLPGCRTQELWGCWLWVFGNDGMDGQGRGPGGSLGLGQMPLTNNR